MTIHRLLLPIVVAATVAVPTAALAAPTAGYLAAGSLAAGSFKKPAVRDSDRDGMPDAWEKANGLNQRRNDARADRDADGLANLAEYRARTNAAKPDTDGDAMRDGWEVKHRLNPLRNDASADPDGDGVSNREECELGDDPHQGDSDHDGTHDGDDDRDEDGTSDRDELRHGRDPRKADEAGKVTTFDEATGALTVTAAAGLTVTVTVTDDTALRWHGRVAACPDPATVADLTPGRTIHDIKTSRKAAVVERISLECS